MKQLITCSDGVESAISWYWRNIVILVNHEGIAFVKFALLAPIFPLWEDITHSNEKGVDEECVDIRDLLKKK